MKRDLQSWGGVSRRAFLSEGFLLAIGAITPPVREILAAADPRLMELPPYYRDYLGLIAGKVNAIAKRTVDGFWFITDLHVQSNRFQSGKALVALSKKAPALTKTICGGDIPGAFNQPENPKTDQQALDGMVEKYISRWVRPIEAAGMDFYGIRGNHDFFILHKPGKEDGYAYSAIETHNVVMDTNACRRAITNSNDPEACYYYFDNPTAKIRYVITDTTDWTDKHPVRRWNIRFGMRKTQMSWLADHAIAALPAGWSAVVAGHVPLTSVVGFDVEEKRYRAFRQFLEAYQNRQKVSLCGKSYDFTEAKGQILLCISGHYHAERTNFHNGILHMTEPCDAAYWDYIWGSAPWSGGLPVKKAGTIYEQTFGAVQLDSQNGLVYVTRFGGGQDRVAHTRAQTVQVGKTLQVKSALLKGPVTWCCYDADRLGTKPNPASEYNPLVNYYNRIATISDKGVLIPKCAGEVVVMARDGHLNKEIFPVAILA